MQIPLFKRLPPFLHTLLTANDPRSRDFQAQLRRYNNIFAFTSVDCKTTRKGVSTGGPMDFQIQGALYHRSGPLQEATGQGPQYAQLYFHDPQFAADFRWLLNDNLDRAIITEITELLHQSNPFILIYRTARERWAQTAGQASLLLNPQLSLILEEGADRRRANLPVADEVAAVVPYESATTGYRDIVLAARGPQGQEQYFRRIHAHHAAYLPLAYPLMLPYGDTGFHWGLPMGDLRNQDRKKLDIGWRQYCRFVLHPRADQFQVPFAFRRLFQQLLVDLWATGDQVKLEWLRRHQKELRADLYQGIQDHLHVQDGEEATADRIGTRIVLPSNYVGGHRFIAQCYQDSMAIVRALGAPVFFITVTANPSWPEILRELGPAQTASDRPDIVGRVFELKTKALIKELRDNLFGGFTGIVWTVEFQKRGLPHKHILLFLSSEATGLYKDVRNLDRVIRAELPTPEEDPDGVLRAVIQSSMVHGPCGAANPSAPCMRAPKPGDQPRCSKGFPKQLRDTTEIPDDGYANYRRRDTGQTVAKKIRGQEVLLDNRWVVPYNPYLSRKYQAHINMELCASVKAIKYIHKYVYKGNDIATVQVQERQDEIAVHLECRYVSPAESVVQLFEFAVHEEFPPVTRLPVHLEGQQPVYFPEDASSQELRDLADRSRSMLMAFFDYNRAHEESRSVLYVDFPRSYVWKPRIKEWAPRQRGSAVGRMYSVPPTAGEAYFLRLLLCNVPGPQSFSHLRTVNDVEHPTFRAACLALGLLDDDGRWRACFTEAAQWQTGFALRRLFSVSLIHGDIADPPALWAEFAERFCDDLPRALRDYPNIPPGLESPYLDYGLFKIQQHLAEFYKSLADFGLPVPQYAWQAVDTNSELQRELRYDEESEQAVFEDICSKFNLKQAAIFQEVIDTVQSTPSQAYFFVQGPGGTGKTFLYKGIAAYFRARNRAVLCVASSGIAALLLPGGRTAHSRFKIPIAVTESSICGIKKNSDLAVLLRNTAVVIWDEVPMQHRHCFEAVDRTLRDVLDTDKLFGGLPMLFGGDFAQILPVVRKGSRAQIVQASLSRSYVWEQLRIRCLTENMRVRGTDQNNRDFIRWLQDLSYQPGLRGWLNPLAAIRRFSSPHDFFTAIYPEPLLRNALVDTGVFADRCILAVTNTAAADINYMVLRSFPSPAGAFACMATTTVEEVPQDGTLPELSPEFLSSVDFPSIPPARLHLKIGVPIILLRNLDAQQGLCNGTRMVVLRIGKNCLRVRVLTGDFAGDIRLIPKIKLTTNEEDFPFKISRVQFPVRLCFAMTINKAQGQSFNIVGVDLRAQVFTHGQFYVAMSRVTDISKLYILEQPGGRQLMNIVYPEVLVSEDQR